MAKQFPEIEPKIREFIEAQHVYFVGTAGAEGRVNVSPKGMNSLRVLGPNRVAWLNVTGSGNETAAHVLENDRMTIMFCAFEGKPTILRLYGNARAVHPRDADWAELAQSFPELPGARQIFDVAVDLVQTSCGMAVPRYEFTEDRDELNRWAEKKGRDGIEDYWRDNNVTSLDGKPTEILG